MDGSVDIEKVKVQNDRNIDELLASITDGKEVKADIFEDIKSISKEGVTVDEEEQEITEATVFECPVCNTQVDAHASVCPGCGAHFAEEAPGEKFECPMCGTTVDADATVCPGCGVEFEEEVVEEEVPAAPPKPEVKPRAEIPTLEPGKEIRPSVTREAPPSVIPKAPPTPTRLDLTNRITKLKTKTISPQKFDDLDKKALYKELPRLVNEVKPLLLSAKKLGINIDNSKQLINEAIAFGKRKDMARAVELVSRAKTNLENAFVVSLTSQLDNFLVEVDKARASGTAVALIEKAIVDVIKALESNAFEEAGKKILLAKDEFEVKAGGYYKAKEALESAENLLQDSSIIGVNVSDANKALSTAKQALANKKWEQTQLEAGKAKDFVLREIPKYLAKEMKQARNILLDMKVKGGDLTKPIGILKQASIHIKREEYEDAVHYVKLFRQEINKI